MENTFKMLEQAFQGNSFSWFFMTGRISFREREIVCSTLPPRRGIYCTMSDEYQGYAYLRFFQRMLGSFIVRENLSYFEIALKIPAGYSSHVEDLIQIGLTTENLNLDCSEKIIEEKLCYTVEFFGDHTAYLNREGERTMLCNVYGTPWEFNNMFKVLKIGFLINGRQGTVDMCMNGQMVAKIFTHIKFKKIKFRPFVGTNIRKILIMAERSYREKENLKECCRQVILKNLQPHCIEQKVPSFCNIYEIPEIPEGIRSFLHEGVPFQEITTLNVMRNHKKNVAKLHRPPALIYQIMQDKEHKTDFRLLDYLGKYGNCREFEFVQWLRVLKGIELVTFIGKQVILSDTSFMKQSYSVFKQFETNTFKNWELPNIFSEEEEEEEKE